MNFVDLIKAVPCKTLPPGVVAVLGHFVGHATVEAVTRGDVVEFAITREMRIEGVIIDIKPGTGEE